MSVFLVMMPSNLKYSKFIRFYLGDVPSRKIVKKKHKTSRLEKTNPFKPVLEILTKHAFEILGLLVNSSATDEPCN